MLVGCATAAAMFPFVGTIVYMIVRPPEYLDDVRERELEIAAAEARLASIESHACPYCDFTDREDLPALPELPAPAQGAVRHVWQAARPALEDLPLLRGRGRPPRRSRARARRAAAPPDAAAPSAPRRPAAPTPRSPSRSGGAAAAEPAARAARSGAAAAAPSVRAARRRPSARSRPQASPIVGARATPQQADRPAATAARPSVPRSPPPTLNPTDLGATCGHGRTLILVKPDAFERGLTGEVLARFERKGLEIAALKHMVRRARYRRGALRRAQRRSRSSASWWTSSPAGPLVALVLEGHEAVKAARQVIGATNPVEAAPGSIRGDFGARGRRRTSCTAPTRPSPPPARSRSSSPSWARGTDQIAAARLTLASRSPQRRAILEQLGISFEVVVPGRRGADARASRARWWCENALRKARAVEGELVLGVDTIVALDGRPSASPLDAAQAAEHLRELSGREHEVLVGHRARRAGRARARRGRRHRAFASERSSAAELDWYVASGEWRERAGGYAIQGRGAALVERIEGDYSNVVGLPVAELVRLAPRAAGRDVWPLVRIRTAETRRECGRCSSTLH